MLRTTTSRFAVPMLVWAAICGAGQTPASGQSFFEPIGSGGPPQAPVVQATAEFTAPAGAKPGELTVTATMTAGWHIYSITQAAGGPVQTKIKTEPPIGVVIGAFTALTEPHVQPEPDFNNLLVESHDGKVSWKAQLSIPPGVDPATLDIKGSVFAQACNTVCLPPQDYKFTAKLKDAAGAGQATSKDSVPATTVAPTNAPSSLAPPIPAVNVPGLPVLNLPPVPAPVVEGYKPRLAKVRWHGRLEPSSVTPGGTAKLHVTATPIEGWHVYAAQNVPLPATGNQATSLVYSDTAGFKTTPLATTQTPLTHVLGETSSLPYFEEPVTRTSDIVVPADAKPGDYKLTGSLGFQTCLKTCLNPEAVEFAATLTVGDTTGGSKPLEFVAPMLHREHAKAFNAWLPVYLAQNPEAAREAAIAQSSGSQSSSLPWMLLTALLAGFILNFMPCVLPVIGLKVLSFIEQSHHDRRRTFLLNFWYSMGMISIFWVLAGLAIGLRLWANTTFGWGKQFSYDGFNIGLAAVVFVMALSFFGIWEIPIPGFAGGKGAQKLASKEGFFGAFTKGAVTTVLATPCSGPFLGTAVAFALRESAPVTAAVFTAMGLGMALPYLVIGVRPSLVKFLPKPGEWMDTFKQIMGFVLLGTVIWLMVPITESKLLSTITLLAGLGASCWWIGRTPAYAETRQKLRAWAGATVFGALVGWLAFAAPRLNDPLDWRPFTLAEFNKELNSGKTVMLEFTADWCLTCKTLKAANLDRTTTKELVNRNGVVVFEADIDDLPEEERKFFQHWQQSEAVPLIAIFSADQKDKPFLFGDGYTQGQILEALEKAGPAKASVDAQAALDPEKVDHSLPWRSFSAAELDQSLQEGKTVLVDFTADWCLTCKVLRAAHLERPATKDLVTQNGVIVMEGDIDRLGPRERELFEKWNPTASVPLVAVLSATNKDDPILFDSGYTQTQILEALRKVGPSKKPAAVSMR